LTDCVIFVKRINLFIHSFLAGLREPTSKGRERKWIKKRKGREKEWEGKGRGGRKSRNTPPSIPAYAPS